MNILYITNPFTNKENGLFNSIQAKYGDKVKKVNFMDIRDAVTIRDTPTVALIHDGYEIEQSNISVLLDTPTIEEVEGALLIDYPYPEPIINDSEVDVIGQEIVSLKLKDMQKDMIINALGQELTNIKLQLLQGGM